MTVAMKLAAATHHSSAKGGWQGATHDALRGQMTASSGGRRPGVLKEPEPANVVERVQRHILEQTVSAPGLQILDAPVSQTVDQLVTALSHVDSFVPEQVIEVPKIPLPPCRPRTALREPQTAEQLVEVPTVVSWSMLIPVPRGSGGQRLQDSLPVQSPAAQPVEQLVDIYSGGGLQGLRPGQGSTAFPGGSSQRTAAQIVDIPVPARVSRSFQGVPAFHDGDHRVRRGERHNYGVHHAEQSSTSRRGAHHHDDHGTYHDVHGAHQFAGQVILPSIGGREGFIESLSAQCTLDFDGDFCFSPSYSGRFDVGDDVKFFARQLPTGWWEAFDLEHF